MNPPYPCMMDRIISQQVVPGVTRCEPAMTDGKNTRVHTTIGDNVYIRQLYDIVLASCEISTRIVLPALDDGYCRDF